MNRRNFIKNFSLLTGSMILAKDSFAGLACNPVMPNIQACTAGLDSTLIGITANAVGGQHQTQWCWAACIEMVFRYYGFIVPQAQIVAETWGEIVNLPGQHDQILADLNRTWTDQSGGRFSVIADTLSVNPITAAQDLAAGMPLIIGSMGHATVLTRVDYLVNSFGQGEIKQAVVRDPWPGKGKRFLTPEEWFNVSFAARIRVRPF
jgi:hypothetical protein